MINWISISDCLPAEYEYVLLSYVDMHNTSIRYVPTVGFLKNNIWHTREGDVECNHPNFDYMREHKLTVTHWVYLPNAPC